jgi:hypothetical protein
VGVFGLRRICKSVTIRGPSDHHSRFVLWRSKDYFFLVTYAVYSDEQSSSFISGPLQCSDGNVKQLADMTCPFSDFRNS